MVAIELNLVKSLMELFAIEVTAISYPLRRLLQHQKRSHSEGSQYQQQPQKAHQ